MITEDYVSFGIAKLLKKKGFDEECETWYAEYWSRWGGEPDGGRSHILFQSNKEHIDDEDYEFLCYAPTINSVLDWLDKTHHIIIHPFKTKIDWYYVIHFPDLSTHHQDGFSSYEKCCEAAIKYCLENLV